MTTETGVRKDFYEISLADLSIEQVISLFPPNSLVTKTHEDTPFGTTVSGLGVYVDPASNLIHVKNVNGEKLREEDWDFSQIRAMK